MINCLFSKDKKSKTDIYFQLGSWTVFRSNSNQFIIQTYVYERIIGIWNTDKKHKSPTIPKTIYSGHVCNAQANDLPILFGLLNIQENFLGLKLVGTSHWITLNKGKLPCSNQILNQHHWTGLFWGELIKMLEIAYHTHFNFMLIWFAVCTMKLLVFVAFLTIALAGEAYGCCEDWPWNVYCETQGCCSIYYPFCCGDGWCGMNYWDCWYRSGEGHSNNTVPIH